MKPTRRLVSRYRRYAVGGKARSSQGLVVLTGFLLTFQPQEPLAGQTSESICGGSWSTMPTGVMTIPAPSSAQSTFEASIVATLDAEFFRVSDGAILPSGAVVVANTGAAELLYFSATGEPLARAGGPGGGPNEFMQLASVRWDPVDATVDAFDISYGLKTFSDVGMHRASVDLRGSYPRVDGFVSGGGHVVVEHRGGNEERGVFRQTYSVTLVRGEGPASDLWTVSRPDRLHLRTGHGFSSLPYPFSGPLWIEPYGRRCLIRAGSEPPDVVIFDQSGTEVLRLRFPWVDVKVSASEWMAWTEDQRLNGGHADEWDFSDVEPPQNRAAWHRAHPTSRGLVWLEPQVGGAESPKQFLRVDIAAGTAAWVDVPVGVRRLLAAEGDRVLLLTTGALDVQSVVIAEVR